MKLQLTDKDLKREAKNKSIEDISIFDFQDRDYLDSRVTPIIHLVKYEGDKGSKVFKDFFDERQSVSRSEARSA